MKKVNVNLKVFILFTVLAVVLTYPLILRIWNSLPAGAIVDPYLNTYILAWDHHRLFSDPFSLFQANTFYPYSNSLAFSEHMIITSLLVLPMKLLTGNIVFSYNVVFILMFALSGFGMYLLVYYLTGDRYAGVIAGIIFAFCPYKYARKDAIQLMSTHFMPFVLLWMHRFFDRSSYRNLLLFCLFYIMMMLSCWHYGIYITVAVMLCSLFFVFRKENLNPDFWKKIIIFIVLSAVVILPFTLPYRSIRVDNPEFFRSFDQVVGWSADVRDYLAPPESNCLYGKLLKRFRPAGLSWEHEMFFGFSVFLLVLYGIIKIRIRKNTKIFVYLALAVFTFVMSLGPYLKVWGRNTGIPLPYTLFYNYFPGFSSIRGVSRISIVFMLAVSVLAGFTVSRIEFKRIKKRIVAGLIIPLVIIAEYLAVPMSTGRVLLKDELPPVYGWLAEQEGDLPMTELDLSVPGEYVSHREAEYMYYSIYHGKRITNGWSGFMPHGHFRILELSRYGFPSKNFVDLLRGLKLKYIVAHMKGVEKGNRAAILGRVSASQDITVVRAFGDDIVLGLKPLSQEEAKPCLAVECLAPDKITEAKKINICVRVRNNKGICYAGALSKLRLKGRLMRNGAVVEKYSRDARMPYYIAPGSFGDLTLSLKMPEYPGIYELEIECEVPGIKRTFVQKREIEVLGTGMYKSDKPGVLKASCSSVKILESVRNGEPFRIEMVISNEGDTLWLSRSTGEDVKKGNVGIGALWYDDKGNEIMDVFGNRFESRLFLPCDVSPGQKVLVGGEMNYPWLEKGVYNIRVDLVSEKVSWFSEKDSQIITRRVEFTR